MSRRRQLAGAVAAPDAPVVGPPSPSVANGRFSALAQQGGGALRTVPIDRIAPDPDQPRRDFAEAEMEELVGTIKNFGVESPPVTVQLPNGDFQIVFGERRWRAAQLAGLTEMEIIVRPQRSAQETLELQMIENMTRAGLTAIEEARTIHRLVEEFGLEQQEVGERLRKGPAWVSQRLALLTLPDDVQEMVSRRELTFGHARALVGIKNPKRVRRLAAKAIADNLSTRELQDLATPPERPGPRPMGEPKRYPDADAEALASLIADAVGEVTSLDVRTRIKKGQIELSVTGPPELLREYIKRLGVEIPDELP